MTTPLTAADVVAARRDGESLMATKRRLQRERGIAPALKVEDLGEIIPANRLFVSQHIGKAEGAGMHFEMMTSLGGNPMVMCVETGKSFSLGWQDVLALAVARGVTNP
ncbi:hypothetical protein [Cupriavidus sp. RAF12]|uniref:hypothetical protein n=1 Tax=Cupriavidus sp. RAF12 TaxID=3233050 RepID=UPI003F8DDF8E